jgi:hypothetical protein
LRVHLTHRAMISYHLVRSFTNQMKKFLRHPLLIALMGLLMLVSFVILQLSVEKIVILGNLSHSSFDWLRNVNYLSSFVRHQDKTAILFPRNIDAERQREKIVCFVMSTPRNRLARSVIRRSWGQVIRPLFIMGLSDKASMSLLENESKVFDDIIVEDFVDTYSNLTIKTAFAMKHFMRHFNNSKYFMKIDDDVFLNPKNLYSFLKSEHRPRNSIIGREGRSKRPHRDRENKWYIPYWLFADDTFPSYIDGPAYLIPGMNAKNMPQYLLLSSPNIPPLGVFIFRTF